MSPIHGTQREIEKWGKQRIADAPRIAKKYREQGTSVELLIAERGCTCDPTFYLPEDKDGPVFRRVEVTHKLGCENK